MLRNRQYVEISALRRVIDRESDIFRQETVEFQVRRVAYGESDWVALTDWLQIRAQGFTADNPNATATEPTLRFSVVSIPDADPSREMSGSTNWNRSLFLLAPLALLNNITDTYSTYQTFVRVNAPLLEITTRQAGWLTSVPAAFYAVYAMKDLSITDSEAFTIAAGLALIFLTWNFSRNNKNVEALSTKIDLSIRLSEYLKDLIDGMPIERHNGVEVAWQKSARNSANFDLLNAIDTFSRSINPAL